MQLHTGGMILSSAVEELSYYILPAFFPEAGDRNYNYDVCNRLGHVLKLYNTYYFKSLIFNFSLSSRISL